MQSAVVVPDPRAGRSTGCGQDACRAVAGLVAAAFQTPLADLGAPTRGRAQVAAVRQTAMYLAHVKLGLTLTAVGRQFGRDRTTVAHACARIEDSRDDPACDDVMTVLEAAVDAWRGGFGGAGGRS